MNSFAFLISEGNPLKQTLQTFLFHLKMSSCSKSTKCHPQTCEHCFAHKDQVKKLNQECSLFGLGILGQYIWFWSFVFSSMEAALHHQVAEFHLTRIDALSHINANQFQYRFPFVHFLHCLCSLRHMLPDFWARGVVHLGLITSQSKGTHTGQDLHSYLYLRAI